MEAVTDWSRSAFATSSYSQTSQEDNCVGVGYKQSDGKRTIGVIDSKNDDLLVLEFAPSAMRTFLAATNAGHFHT